MSRTIGYTVFLGVTPLGGAALLAVVLTRWTVYQGYRATGVQPDVPHRLVLVFLYLMLSAGAVAVAPVASLSSLQGAALLAVLAARAHRPLRALTRQTVADLRGWRAADSPRNDRDV